MHGRNQEPGDNPLLVRKTPRDLLGARTLFAHHQALDKPVSHQ